MEVVRNVGRRKLRSSLTIIGIVIGIFALTTMGAVAEHFNALIGGAVDYFGSGIAVSADSGGQFSLLPVGKAEEIERVEGVEAVYPSITVPVKPGEVSTVSFGVPDTIYSSVPGEKEHSKFRTSVGSGRDLKASSRGEVVLGTSIAAEFKKKVGDSIDLPVRPHDAKPDFVNHSFRVAGIVSKTDSAPDTAAYVSLPDAQMLLKESLPATVRGGLDVSQLTQGFVVFGRPGASLSELDRIADRIKAQVAGVKTTRPTDVVNSFKTGGATFAAMTTGAALLALFVGGLSVVNTMLMAVAERKREIGLKKAVGAHTWQVLREYLLEAVVIGLTGAVTGYMLGVLLTNALNVVGRATNSELFLITPTLTVLSLAFGVGLGAAAGFIPALRAARLDPVTALRTAN